MPYSLIFCYVLQDVGSIAISKTTKERMAQKYRQKQEEAERKHANHERIDTHALAAETAQKTREMEQKKKQEELRIKREKERQQEKLRKLSSSKEEEIKGEMLCDLVCLLCVNCLSVIHTKTFIMVWNNVHF